MVWELVVQTLGTGAGAIYAWVKLRDRMSTRRSTLKTDLEILKMLDPSDSNYPLVKAHVDATIESIYRPIKQEATKGIVVYNWSDLIFGTIFFVGFVIWTVYLLKGDLTWWSLWAIVTGFLALGGLGGMLNAFDEKRQRERKKVSDISNDNTN